MYKVCGYLLCIIAYQYNHTKLGVYYSKSNSSDEIPIKDVFQQIELADGDAPFPEDVGYHVARISVSKKCHLYDRAVMQLTWYILWLE